MPETVRYADITRIEADYLRRFGDVNAILTTVQANVLTLMRDKDKQDGAAAAIAEAADRRGKHTIAVVACISGIAPLLTLLIQKHWLGL